ncbi:MAG: hypothetical protein GX616_04280 [Planctomycetes bacterium]|nr:hypothetical protein [Planctomycetota bacterium]
MSTVTAHRVPPPAPNVSAFQSRADQLVSGIRDNPNNHVLIDVMQKLLAETNRDLALQRLLFEWYTLSTLDANMKGRLLALIVNTIRCDARIADQVNFGLDSSGEAFKAIYRGFKYHLDNAIESMILVSRLQNHQYTIHTSPKFIVAVPKSGSSLLGICLGNMMRLVKEGKFGENPFEWSGYPAWWEQGTIQDWDLRPEIGMDPLFLCYPGGVYKGHIPPTPKNLRILRLYPESRYVITVREPRDQLVAWFCHNLRPTAGQQEPLTESQVHERLDRMMTGGTLLESLQFLGRWLTVREPERSIVITYEAFINDPLRELHRMRDLYQLNLTDEQVARVYEYSTPYTNRETGEDRSGHDRSIYPLGWTGYVDIHKRYFSQENLRTFDRVFEAFCQMCPWGEPIKQLYPR